MEMKADLTNYNDQKRFNALYWGQPVGITWVEVGSVEVKSCQAQDGFMLQLKPLSQISDEDIIKLYKLITPEDNGWIVGRSLEYRRDWLKRLKYQQNLNSDIVDFIRSIGVAYKWMGLSVEEMVEAGWIKLTK